MMTEAMTSSSQPFAIVAGAGHDLRRLHDSGERGQTGHRGHDQNLDLDHVDSAESGCLDVAAHGVDRASEGGVVHQDLGEGEHQHENDRREGDSQEVATAEEVVPLGKRCEWKTAGNELGRSGQHGHPGQCRNEGWNPEVDADQPGEGTDGKAQGETRKHGDKQRHEHRHSQSREGLAQIGGEAAGEGDGRSDAQIDLA